LESPTPPATTEAAIPASLVATDDSIVAVGGSGDRGAASIAFPVGIAAPPAPPAPVTHPAGFCPSGTIDLATIISLNGAARVRCFASRTVRFHAFVLQPEDLGGTCGCKGTPTWLTGGGAGYPAAWLAPLDAPFGRIDNLPAFAPPSVKGATQTLRWVSVTGHFDDPASSNCRITSIETGALLVSRARSVAACRESFVVTRIVTIAAPDPAAGLRIASPYSMEPSDAGIDGVPAEVVAIGMADVWKADAPIATVLVLRTALSPTATTAFTARIAKDQDQSSRRSILGVSVAFTPDGGTATFTLGHRTFVVSGDGSSGPAPAEILAIVTALIRGNR
jgi:hypothetical protein